MHQHQYQTITTWQDKTFTKATALSCVHHLIEEVQELKTDLEKGTVNHEEIADCFLLLFAVCNKLGLNYDAVVKIIDDKMNINYQRTWGEPNELGYVKHV